MTAGCTRPGRRAVMEIVRVDFDRFPEIFLKEELQLILPG
jgi:hypothetical protein